MDVLREHYAAGFSYLGMLRLDAFLSRFSLKACNELNSLRRFNSRKRIAIGLVALYATNTEPEQVLNSVEPEKELLNLVEKAKSQVEEFVPEIRGHVLFCIASTPDVIAKESGRTFGDAVGVAQTVGQTGENAPQAVSPVKGLFHVGADIGSSGIATEMATQSALDLFEKVF